jgi:hypothetical protein
MFMRHPEQITHVKVIKIDSSDLQAHGIPDKSNRVGSRTKKDQVIEVTLLVFESGLSRLVFSDLGFVPESGKEKHCDHEGHDGRNHPESFPLLHCFGEKVCVDATGHFYGKHFSEGLKKGQFLVSASFLYGGGKTAGIR